MALSRRLLYREVLHYNEENRNSKLKINKLNLSTLNGNHVFLYKEKYTKSHNYFIQKKSPKTSPFVCYFILHLSIPMCVDWPFIKFAIL